MTETRVPGAHAGTGEPSMPLAGLRVLELGQLDAGPFACSLLVGFGAEVVEIEQPAPAIRASPTS